MPTPIPHMYALAYLAILLVCLGELVVIVFAPYSLL